MNNYFSSVFTIEQLNNVTQLGQYEGNILDTINFSTEEVQEKLKHLNMYKSTGPYVLDIPEDWKSANMIVIHMKGSSQKPGNYRTH